MATATWKDWAFLFPAIGLLVLAGTAWAQLDCPLPAGVAPPSEPRVTAQEVEDGSASLTTFALAVRDQIVSDSRGIVSTGQAAYAGCLFRQEGSAWRSGSTYLVQLDLTGRVLIHAKDMSLSARLLDPVIYEAILQALGIDPAVLADPAAAFATFTAAASGDGGPFDVPGVPGASGYATVFRPGGQLRLRVQLAGADIDESHLVPIADEAIDYGDPKVAAEDVVDRATLKAYATAAATYVTSRLESSGPDAFVKARIALRDADGPWRHDRVYVGITERASELIVFHGAFPDRFELRQGGVATDVATGELVFDQLIAAAESGPEGGFWLYHFDSPIDDTDSEDIPKLGYARIFTVDIPLPDGRTLPTDFIINSGFYLNPDSVFVRRLLGALDDGQTSIMFGITTPDDGDAVDDVVDVTVMGAPTDAVHFAYRLAGATDEPFTYAGAATNREAVASFAWDTLGLPDDDYELAALYTEDDGYSVIYDAIEVSVDNVGGGGGGCVAVPVLPGGPVDPTLAALVGLLLVYLTLRRRCPIRRAALG